MPLYKDQGVVLGSFKLAEADKIVTILTEGEGKVRAVAKGIRRTKSRFGARLEPLTHIDLMCYRGRSLDTVTQVEILHPFRKVRDDVALFTAGEAMLEAADAVASEHERNIQLYLLLLRGLRALEARPADPAAVAESYLLKLLAVSGFGMSASACAVCGRTPVAGFSPSAGGAVCSTCEERDGRRASPEALAWLDEIARADLEAAGVAAVAPDVRAEARAMLVAFAEHHLDRRIRSLPHLVRLSAAPAG